MRLTATLAGSNPRPEDRMDPITGAKAAKTANPMITAAANASRMGTRHSIKKSFHPAL